MGFLLGAYGKLAAGSRYRSLQARMMRIQSKLRRVTRDVASMEKMIDYKQKSMTQELTMQNTMGKQYYQQMMNTAMAGTAGYTEALQTMQNKDASADDMTKAAQLVSSVQQQFSSKISSMSAACDTQTALNKQQVENYIEQLRDQLLEPLKDQEDSLQLEKDTLESQIQVAQQDYQACQKMEQQDAKMLAPNYTGSGQG